MHLKMGNVYWGGGRTAGKECRRTYFTTRLRTEMDFGQSAESEVSPIAAACVAVQEIAVLLVSR